MTYYTIKKASIDGLLIDCIHERGSTSKERRNEDLFEILDRALLFFHFIEGDNNSYLYFREAEV